MDTEPGTIFGREPTMVLALVQAVIAWSSRSASASHPTRSARSSRSPRSSSAWSRGAGWARCPRLPHEGRLPARLAPADADRPL